MKPNELRINNIVKMLGFEVGIFNISHEVGKNPIINECEELDLFEPLPLTEEWLLKFGFTKSSNVDGELIINEQIELGIDSKGYFYPGSNVYLKYVHQLQNLYFALTGEELTIK